jgi:uncharacterized membrane protein HdeD (DUF308 family)
MELEDVFYLNPGSVILRGVIAILFGILFMAWPGISLEVMVLLCASFALIDGIIIIIMAFAAKGRWAQLVPLGVVGVMLGILIFIWPQMSVTVLILLVAVWAIISGLSQFISIWAVKIMSSGAKWLYAISGILSIILGVILFWYPIATTLIFIWIFGLYAVVFGIVMLISGIWMNSLIKKSGMNTPKAA